MEKRQWIIGRAPDCDLVVNHPSVSSRHCRLVETDEGFLIEDLHSTNGTFVNGVLALPAVPVTRGDRVTLGLGVPMPWPEGIVLPSERLASAGRDDAHSVLDLSAALRGKPIVFGREPSCDQVLNYPMISRRHARLYRSGNALVLEDLGSTNGTFLNRRRIKQPTAVQVGDVIGLGSFTYQLIDPSRLEKFDFRGNVTLEAKNVTIDVPKRRLLENVSLTIYPSEFVGLMGPSGAGKTTLMNALNGYTPPTAGRVFLNGQDLYANYAQFSSYLGYVPQDDIMHRDLTVGQALYYTARLRLPADYAEPEINNRIREVLKQLGLEGTENVLIGSPERKGISGGQRKRVNLAMELLTDPLVLFLDEPTSGLSSEDALMVMKVLRRLADSGKTILLTIHQPSLEAFRLMDNLVLVSKDQGSKEPGRLVYYGPAYPDAVHFFNPQGVPNLRPGADPSPDEVLRGLARSPTAEWTARYENSRYCQEYVQERASKQAPGTGSLPPPKEHRLLEFSQWWMLVQRCLIIKAKDTWNTAILMAQAPIVALLVVIVFGQQVREAESLRNWSLTTSPAMTLFLLALAALWFGSSNAVREIVGEWAIYHRERMVNLKIPSYVASKFAVLGGLCFLQCCILLAIISWGCGLKGSWFLMFCVLFLVSLVGVGLGLTLSAVARTSEVAIALLPLILIPMVILAGVMQPLQKMNTVVRSIAHLTPSRWAFEGLLLLESNSRPRFPVAVLPSGQAPPSGVQQGVPGAIPLPNPPNAGVGLLGKGQKTQPEEADLAENYFPRDRRAGVGASMGVLVAMLLVLFVAIQLILRARDVHRPRLQLPAVPRRKTP